MTSSLSQWTGGSRKLDGGLPSAQVASTSVSQHNTRSSARRRCSIQKGGNMELWKSSTFWPDKVCIDQQHIADGLRILPVNVTTCLRLLVLCGPLTRFVIGAFGDSPRSWYLSCWRWFVPRYLAPGSCLDAVVWLQLLEKGCLIQIVAAFLVACWQWWWWFCFGGWQLHGLYNESPGLSCKSSCPWSL